MDGSELLWLLEGDDTGVVFFVKTTEIVAKGVSFREGSPLVEVLIESHGLHEIAHPLFTEIHAGELIVNGIFQKRDADEEKLFFAVAA